MKIVIIFLTFASVAIAGKDIKKEQSDEDICSLPEDVGDCYGYIPRFYFDKSTGTCKRFYYGGCGGNKNNFKRVQYCEQTCGVEIEKSICSLPPRKGICDAAFSRYYFDKSTGDCKEFVYGGCDGNENNFRTLEKCRNACVCGKHQQYDECGTFCPLTCDNVDDPPIFCIKMCKPGCHCKEGYVESNDGQCVKPENCPAKAEDLIQHNCVDEPETGICDAYFPMWYYDEKSRTCKRFVYGGCGGNGNKYESEQECLNSCKG